MYHDYFSFLKSLQKMTAIGIDLGTTNSVVSCWIKNKVNIYENDEGNSLTPSIVAFTDSDIMVGIEAKKQVKF
jgi:molecular chaperone DnaK (HSP70)